MNKLNKLADTFYRKQAVFYKIILYLFSVLFMVYLFPKAGGFKYEFQKGKPWQYENLYAPFDFSILKTKQELLQEQKQVKQQHIPYYALDTTVASLVKKEFYKAFSTHFSDTITTDLALALQKKGIAFLDTIYKKGVVLRGAITQEQIHVISGNTEKKVVLDNLLHRENLRQELYSFLKDSTYVKPYYSLFFDIVTPNIVKDTPFTQKTLEQELRNISYTRGLIDKNKRIIAKGEIIEAETYQILESLKQEYVSTLWNENNYNWMVLGYVILVGITLLMLLLFLKKYRYSIFENNTKLTFIFFNILLMVFLTTLLVKYSASFVYVVPLCILPLLLRAFFDARLGFFVHVLTVLLLGFIVPNSFEYLFLQITAGVVTILTLSELYKRANLFISVGQITLVYLVGYIAFYMIREGSIIHIDWAILGYFCLNGLGMLFTQPLIYMYERVFGLVSDVSLLELSDTNSPLLKELSDVAPGSFYHSLQVANLAEAAANEIGANAMLVRVGALYHDIGKMKNPMYFTENQTTSVNPHDELSAQESATIILDHVLHGIEIAKKYNIPDRIIDFIRTHHGTSTVYYFYKQAQELDPQISPELFSYKGPLPFSKETAILMMSDAVEAASKSLKNPTYTIIDTFVDKIINKQISEGQFLNATITFKEIEMIKKVLKRKLTNIYHLRITYPE